MTHSFPTRRSSELGWRQRGHRLDQGSGESQPLPAGVDGALGEQIPVDGKPAQIDRRAEPAARDADGPGRDAQGSESGDAGRWSAGFVDRKSVVEGKSVSVRVDIGGRRIIKKKKKKNPSETTRETEKTYRNQR